MKVHPVGSCAEQLRVTRLVLAARALDETLGCGGLLSKYGPESAVVLLTQPDDVARQEFVAAQEVLGYSRSFHCDRPVGRAGLDAYSLLGQVRDLLNALRPVALYVPYPAVDPDRVAAFEVGMRLARSTLHDRRWVPPTVLMYGMPIGTPMQYVEDVDWRVCESLEDVDIDRKSAAVAAYRTEPRVLPATHKDIRTFARNAGSARRVRWAERFAVIRGGNRFASIEESELVGALR